MRWRVPAYLLIAVCLAAAAYPALWPVSRDSFPLSGYPMFSSKLPTASFSLQYAVGVRADGSRVHLAPSLVANAEVLQARVVLRDTVRRGPAAIQALCESIAGRVLRARRTREVVEIRVVTGRHDAVAYLTGRDREGSERVHGRCSVARAQGAAGVAP